MCNIFAIKHKKYRAYHKGYELFAFIGYIPPWAKQYFLQGACGTVLLPKSHNVLGFNNHLSGNKTLQTELKYSYPSLRYCIFCTSGTNPISEQFTKKMF